MTIGLVHRRVFIRVLNEKVFLSERSWILTKVTAVCSWTSFYSTADILCVR